jgi:hypothetical protein
MAKRILILLLLAGALSSPSDLSSCGPFLPEAVFTGQLEPLDEARFFGGHLDVLQPNYRRIYLMAAYRYLAGIGLDQHDQEALLAKVGDSWIYQGSPAVLGWLHVRDEVGAPPLDRIDPMKWFPGNIQILNCSEDAFLNAAATVIARGRSGASHDDLRAWVAAQDQVFAKCSSPAPWQTEAKPAPPSIPAPLPAGAAQWMQADRAYQIAAAEF